MNHWKTWHGGVHTHFIPQWSCYCDPALWAIMVVIQSIIQRHLWADIYPSTKHMQSCQPFCQSRHPWPLPITWNLHPSSVDAPVDIHGRSHSFPLIHPREAFLVWHWVIARPSSSCGVVLLSLPLGVGWTGVGWYICPALGNTHTQGNGSFVTLWGGVSCNVGCMNVIHFIWGNICCDLTHHLMRLILPSILDLPLPFKGVCLD